MDFFGLVVPLFGFSPAVSFNTIEGFFTFMHIFLHFYGTN